MNFFPSENLILNGYSDWYLPSYDELYAMTRARNIITNESDKLGGDWLIRSGYYWSSTASRQDYSEEARGYRLPPKETNTPTSRSSMNYFRPIRSF